MTGSVFVTGGSGLVGSAVVRHLVAGGRRVVGLARSDEAAARLVGLGAEPVRGDLGDPASLAEGMQGCEVAFHVAGLNEVCLPDPSPLYRVNVAGAVAAVRAAAGAGVRRLVLTSSASAIGERKGEVGREDSAHRGSFLSHYERSKRQGELAALETGAALGVEVVAVNPSSVQGPGRTGGTAKLLLAYLDGRLRVAVDTRVSVVDVDDCAAGHLLAAERGTPGERYLLSGASASVSALMVLLSEITGLRDRPRMLPPAAVLAAGAVVGSAFRLAGRRAPLCPEAARMLVHGHVYDGSRAERELGLAYTSLEGTLSRTVAWYVERGLVTRPLPAWS